MWNIYAMDTCAELLQRLRVKGWACFSGAESEVIVKVPVSLLTILQSTDDCCLKSFYLTLIPKNPLQMVAINWHNVMSICDHMSPCSFHEWTGYRDHCCICCLMKTNLHKYPILRIRYFLIHEFKFDHSLEVLELKFELEWEEGELKLTYRIIRNTILILCLTPFRLQNCLISMFHWFNKVLKAFFRNVGPYW